MKYVEIHVPNKSYDGYYGGVKFSKGVGVFTDIELAKDLASRYGYELVEVKSEEKAVEVKEKSVPKKRTKKASE